MFRLFPHEKRTRQTNHGLKSPIVITKLSPYFLYCASTNMTNKTVDNRLTDFLNEGKDWERKQTNVPGVFLLKLPAELSMKLLHFHCIRLWTAHASSEF
jgi:hypothetical protein